MSADSIIRRMNPEDREAAIECMTAYFRDSNEPASIMAFRRMTRAGQEAFLDLLADSINLKRRSKYERDY